ncbi:MAG: hypothetical protein OHK0048_01040 [Rhodoferax sp.]
MLRLNLLLTALLVVSALVLVNTQFQSRRLYSALDKARSQARELAVERERLQVEKRALATSSRVERLARAKLGMVSATPAITVYVNAPAATASSVASAAGSRP